MDPRGQLLRAAIGFAGCSQPSYNRALDALCTWLDSWAGIGHVAVGMHQGYDLQLTQYDDRGWRATFYTTGMEHSPTSATGHGLGAHALAHDAAGGVGCAEAGERLDGHLAWLEPVRLPELKALDVQLNRLRAGQC